jgi:hypothetical protein
MDRDKKSSIHNDLDIFIRRVPLEYEREMLADD